MYQMNNTLNFHTAGTFKRKEYHGSFGQKIVRDGLISSKGC